VGKGTKHLGSFLECTKTYEAVVLFGAATDTYDLEGKVVNRAPYGHVTREKVEKALGAYRGKIMQTPPIYSALRLNGKRLYDYARSGEALPSPIQPRPVEVLDLEIVEWMDGGTHKYQWPDQEADCEEKQLANQAFDLLQGKTKSPPVVGGTKRKLSPGKQGRAQGAEAKSTKKVRSEEEGDGVVNSLAQDTESRGSPIASSPQPAEHPSEPATPTVETSSGGQPPAVKLRMTVTSGFYVRSLCHDLGRAMNTFALMGELVRTRQGDFELGRNVLEFDDLEDGEEVWGPKVEGYLNDWTDREGSRSAPLDVEHASG
jgi:tRNA pseudouridine55 synthase